MRIPTRGPRTGVGYWRTRKIIGESAPACSCVGSRRDTDRSCCDLQMAVSARQEPLVALLEHKVALLGVAALLRPTSS